MVKINLNNNLNYNLNINYIIIKNMSNNTNIKNEYKLYSPNIIKNEYPITEKILNFVNETRQEIINILNNKSKRKIIIIGPCSIHDYKSCMEFGRKLKILIDKYSDKLLIIMRTYFEKPRTSVGWKGLINNPDLDNKYDINKGLKLARNILLDLNNIGVPCSYECLETITPNYISDLISWSAIGARTVESQLHRQLVSGLSMPVGFKNSTNGDCNTAICAVISAQHNHNFLGINDNGDCCIFETKGNKNTHIILRGSNNKSNYDEKTIKELLLLLKKKKLNTKILIDCSHGNSNKNYKNQIKVCKKYCEYMKNMEINNKLIGLMIECHLYEGKQEFIINKTDKNKLKYGISITDSCISIEDGDMFLNMIYNSL